MSNPFRSTYNRIIQGDGTYINGVWTPASSTATTTLASIQPVTGRELESLNIGQEGKGKVKIYTDDSYNISEEGASKTGDYIEFDGYYWEIIAKESWRSGIINHYKYYAEKRDAVS